MLTFGCFDRSILNAADTVIVTDSLLSEEYRITGDNVFILPRGEQAKAFEWVESLCSFLLSRNISKTGRLIAVGGGSVGDTSGFAAAVYKRGISFVNYPTTLLAMTDSAIGGKTAVDIGTIKNAAGLFYPADIIIDISFLSTLPTEALRDAWGEIIKYTFLSEDIYTAAKSVRDTAGWYDLRLIELCAYYKYNLTLRVSREGRLRRKLNMGHTFGHALESLWGISHGRAVLYGLYYENLLARSVFHDRFYGECAERILALGIDIDRPFPEADAIMPLLMHDKKNMRGRIRFVFPAEGFATVEKLMTPDELMRYLPL